MIEKLIIVAVVAVIAVAAWTFWFETTHVCLRNHMGTCTTWTCLVYDADGNCLNQTPSDDPCVVCDEWGPKR